MVDRHRHPVNQIEEPRSRPRWGSLANERALLDLLDEDQQNLHQSLKLAPINNSNIYTRRHSAHACPVTEEQHAPIILIPPPVPQRVPAVPKRTHNFASQIKSAPPNVKSQIIRNVPDQSTSSVIPPIPPLPKSRALPPIPPADTKPRPLPPVRKQTSIESNNINNCIIAKKIYDINKNPPPPPLPKPKTTLVNNKLNNGTIDNNDAGNGEPVKIPPAPVGPPPPVPRVYHKPANKVSCNQHQQCNGGRVSIRQDSSVSSDSFSQTSSPSYTTKTMETPLLPPKIPLRQQNGILAKVQKKENNKNGNATITKSVSTPASLQTIVRFHNGSNMSLHHRIIRDMRRPSENYNQNINSRFRFAQIILNAIALFAIGAGMAAYFKGILRARGCQIKVNKKPPDKWSILYKLASSASNYLHLPFPSSVQVVNKTINVTLPPSTTQSAMRNPAPGVCLPVIVNFCLEHQVPYNFTVFPNYIGQFGQRDAQQELELYDAIVDVRCYELSALFLCSLFAPKCEEGGELGRPCRNLCYETKRRCGFFLDVFGLTLPDYLECSLFPETPDFGHCIGYHEVIRAQIKSQTIVCPSGFQCDEKRCIPKDWQCDGHMDCEDRSDELNCKKCSLGMIHCGGDKCITQDHMCDGIVDCPWGQDERNCLRLSDRNGDEGKGQLEVYKAGPKRWVPACIVHWDQKTSAINICSLLGYTGVNNSRLYRGAQQIQDTTAFWRLNQQKPPTNMIREFGTCNGTNYPTVALNCTNFVCGKARKSNNKRGREKVRLRIVGGVVAKPGDWPFLAALLGGPEEIFYCAGVLIADQWVLTASHCVGNHTDVQGWTIQLGITRRHSHSFYGQKMKVKKVVPHPHYNLGVAHDNDVALFQLASRVSFHEHLLPVCLPSANEELRPGTRCTVIGWGKKEDTGVSEYEPEVNEVEVPVLPRDLCNSWLERRDLNVTDGMICAGYKEGGKDACQGDSGGPLLCRQPSDPERWFVGGIVSWGIKCAHPHLPGVYAYVPKYIPWILEQMNQYNDPND